MKKAIITIGKIALTVVVVLMMGVNQVALSQGSQKPNNPELTFKRNVNDRPVFQLNLNNVEADEFQVVIKNEDQEIIYSNWIKGTNISQGYRLDLEDEDLKNVVFEIRSKKSSQSQVYHINKSSKIINEISVAKL